MEIEFFTPGNLNQLWEFVRMLLKMVSPGILISFAITCAGIVLTIVVKMFSKSAKTSEEDDIEIRHY